MYSQSITGEFKGSKRNELDDIMSKMADLNKMKFEASGVDANQQIQPKVKPSQSKSDQQPF